MNFFTALIFALVFFGIWALKESASANPPPGRINLLIAAIFLILAFALGRFA